MDGGAVDHGGRLSSVRVNLLHGMTLYVGDRCLEVPAGVQRVIAYLALGGRTRRAAVASCLWPDVPEDQAGAALRSALWRAQRLRRGLIDSAGSTLAIGADVRID